MNTEIKIVPAYGDHDAARMIRNQDGKVLNIFIRKGRRTFRNPFIDSQVNAEKIVSELNSIEYVWR